MRGYTVAASVAGALLSSGVISAFARTPAGASIEDLRNRMANLELELGKARTQTSSHIITSPFMVKDPAGKPILVVDVDQHSNHLVWMGGSKGTVQFIVNGGGGFGMEVQNDSGKPAVSIGSVKGGHGVVQVNKDGTRVASLSDMGLITWNPAGQEITHLGAEPTDKDRGELKVRGVFAILDGNFNTVIDGGTLPDGRGAIRTWPNEQCRTFAGLRPPTCVMGVKP